MGECQAVLVFNCSDEVMTERIIKRGQSSGRPDDNEDTIRKRLKTHAIDIPSVIEYYRQKLGKVHTVSYCIKLHVHHCCPISGST